MNSKNGEYMIEVEDLHKGFDGNQVLDGVTCQIPAGKISVVMGANPGRARASCCGMSSACSTRTRAMFAWPARASPS